MTVARIEAVVPAAGWGARFRGIKPLMPRGKGTALGEVVHRLHEAGIETVHVIVGHHAAAVAAEARRVGATPIENPSFGRGLASSLHVGLDAVSQDAAGILIHLADMPDVDPTTLRAVIAAADAGASIVRPTYDGRPGFPVYFAARHRAELKTSLRGDRGARDYIAEHRQELVTVDVEDAGCVTDIDRQETGSEDGARGTFVHSA